MKKDLILVGGGGHCIACIDVIELQDKYRIIGIIDVKITTGQKVGDYYIIGNDKDIPKLSKLTRNFLITIGHIESSTKRSNIYNLIKEVGMNLVSIVSPLAYVSSKAKVGAGTIIMHHALVNSNAQIGENCIINTKALVEHDAHIGNHCHISTCAVINGGVKVGQGTFFGSGAVSKQYVSIPANSFIKAHSIYKGDK